MIVFRLCKEKFKSDLSGSGAEKAGGRWNSKGNPVLYTSESRSLCTAEIAVHTPLNSIPLDYYLVTLEIPTDIAITELRITDLPGDWKTIPHSNSTQLIGDKFLSDREYAVLKVPSVVVQGDSNYLLNPQHPLFEKIKIINTELFAFDDRLFK